MRDSVESKIVCTARVLFLDFDGVLNSMRYFERVTGQRDGITLAAFTRSQFDPEAVERLNKLLDQTGAAVVVSSSWRLAYKRTQLCDLLNEVGFRGKVLGMTPNLMTDTRAKEIAAWLGEHRKKVGAFAIVDDDHTAGVGFAPQFVHTTFAEGLTDEAAERLAAILTREPDDAD